MGEGVCFYSILGKKLRYRVSPQMYLAMGRKKPSVQSSRSRIILAQPFIKRISLGISILETAWSRSSFYQFREPCTLYPRGVSFNGLLVMATTGNHNLSNYGLISTLLLFDLMNTCSNFNYKRTLHRSFNVTYRYPGGLLVGELRSQALRIQLLHLLINIVNIELKSTPTEPSPII